MILPTILAIHWHILHGCNCFFYELKSILSHSIVICYSNGYLPTLPLSRHHILLEVVQVIIMIPFSKAWQFHHLLQIFHLQALYRISAVAWGFQVHCLLPNNSVIQYNPMRKVHSKTRIYHKGQQSKNALELALKKPFCILSLLLKNDTMCCIHNLMYPFKFCIELGSYQICHLEYPGTWGHHIELWKLLSVQHPG